MKYALITIIIFSLIPLASAFYSTGNSAPDMKIVNKSIAELQQDLAVQVTVFDKDYPLKMLDDAFVTVYIEAENGKIISYNGTTNRYGYVAFSHFITNHEFADHEYYKINVTALINDKESEKSSSFWTTVRS